MPFERLKTIGQLSEAAGVPTSTVRYYERTGLLEPSGRTDGNYRVYGPEALERLRFIRAAQGAGFKLDDIGTLLEFRDVSAASCGEVQTIISSRLAELEGRLRDMNRLKSTLDSYLARCRSEVRRGHCYVMDALTSESAPESDR